jgi:hypothetical protein
MHSSHKMRTKGLNLAIFMMNAEMFSPFLVWRKELNMQKTKMCLWFLCSRPRDLPSRSLTAPHASCTFAMQPRITLLKKKWLEACDIFDTLHPHSRQNRLVICKTDGITTAGILVLYRNLKIWSESECLFEQDKTPRLLSDSEFSAPSLHCNLNSQLWQEEKQFLSSDFQDSMTKVRISCLKWSLLTPRSLPPPLT